MKTPTQQTTTATTTTIKPNDSPCTVMKIPAALPLNELMNWIKQQEKSCQTGATSNTMILKTPVRVPKELRLDGWGKGCPMLSELQAKVRSVSGNDRCCDCGAPHPDWASITLSSLICLNCAGAHRSLGVKKSRIRSLNLDSWSSSQTLRMLAGGNARLQAALRSNGVEWSMTGQHLSVPAACDRYGSAHTTVYARALDDKCATELNSESDGDEAPGFGGFMLNQVRRVKRASVKILSPFCATNSNNRETRESANTMCCIGTSFYQLIKNMTRFCSGSVKYTATNT